MTRDELDLIHSMFRDAPYEQIPSLWFQFGAKLLSAAEKSVKAEEGNANLMHDEEVTITSQGAEGGYWKAAYATLYSQLQTIIDKGAPEFEGSR